MKFVLELGYSWTGNYGSAIIILSLVVNVCLLPAYYQAELWQNRERQLQRRFQPKLEEFQRAFAGSTLHLVTRAYYRQQSYRPVFALRASLGLFLQVPFFLAAYQLLSHYNLLSGQSFIFLADLNRPDQLLFLLGEQVNLLPFVMTAFNLAAVTVYGRKLLAKELRQIYLLSLLFFVLLYQSPAALLLYWTCNNIFSLLKNSTQYFFTTTKFSKKDQESKVTQQGLLARFLLWPLQWVNACFRAWRNLCNHWQNNLVWGLRLLQFLALSLFVDRCIFFKVTDSSVPEATQALYLAIGCILLAHVLQLGILFWRSKVRCHLEDRSFFRAKCNYSVVYRSCVWGVSLLLLFALLPLLLWSLQDYHYFGKVLYDRVILLLISLLLALVASSSLEFWGEKPSFWHAQSERFSTQSSAQLWVEKRSRTYATLFPPALLPLTCFLQPRVTKPLLGQRKKTEYSEVIPFCNILCWNLLVFFALPLAFSSSSPSEFPQIFSDLKNGLLPIFALSTALLVTVGILLRSANQGLYTLFQLFSYSILFLSFINVFFLPGDYGTMSDFVWDQPSRFDISTLQNVLDFFLLLGLGAIPIILWRKNKMMLLQRLASCLLAVVLIFISYHLLRLQQNLSKLKLREAKVESPVASADNEEIQPLLRLSPTGQNVVVLMLDRFIGGFIPELLHSYPELKKQYQDFTWYANTLSLGPNTLVSMPSILGGYDYSILAINERLENGSAESLAQEINHAYQVLPKIFQQQGYNSLVINPQYANFAARGDLSIFDGTGIEAHELGATFSPRWLRQKGIVFKDLGGRTDFMLAMLGLFRTAMPSLRTSIYDEAEWLGANSAAKGKYRKLVNEWSALYYMPEFTVADGSKPTYLYMNNLVSHEPDFMGRELEPVLQPFAQMTNDEKLRFQNLSGARHFYADASVLKLVARWLQRLRHLGVYDNTTIILLSDHSYDIYDPTMKEAYPAAADRADLDGIDPGYLHPLLLVKPAKAIASSPSAYSLEAEPREMQEDWESFMSVADLSAILQRELGFPMRDPFTGKVLSWQRSQQEKAKGLAAAVDTPWNIANIHVQVEVPKAVKVQKSIFDMANWSRLW